MYVICVMGFDTKVCLASQVTDMGSLLAVIAELAKTPITRDILEVIT